MHIFRSSKRVYAISRLLFTFKRGKKILHIQPSDWLAAAASRAGMTQGSRRRQHSRWLNKINSWFNQLCAANRLIAVFCLHDIYTFNWHFENFCTDGLERTRKVLLIMIWDAKFKFSLHKGQNLEISLLAGLKTWKGWNHPWLWIFSIKQACADSVNLELSLHRVAPNCSNYSPTINGKQSKWIHIVMCNQS